MADSKLVKIVVIISPLIALLMCKLTDILGVNSICLHKIITGKDCIGCNITHSIIACLNGDFVTAFTLNKSVCIVLPILIYVWLKYIYKNVISRKNIS